MTLRQTDQRNRIEAKKKQARRKEKKKIEKRKKKEQKEEKKRKKKRKKEEKTFTPTVWLHLQAAGLVPRAGVADNLRKQLPQPVML